jgi:hypothetical protein
MPSKMWEKKNSNWDLIGKRKKNRGEQSDAVSFPNHVVRIDASNELNCDGLLLTVQKKKKGKKKLLSEFCRQRVAAVKTHQLGNHLSKYLYGNNKP